MTSPMTLKYHPEFPDRFGSVQDTRSFLLDFFLWYNTMQHHKGLGLLTPFDLHHGLAEQRLTEREAALRKAFEATPERFVRGVPSPPALPQAVWINKPRPTDETAPRAVALPCEPSSADPAARRARGAPDGVAQRARRAGDGDAEAPVAVAEQAKELYAKF